MQMKWEEAMKGFSIATAMALSILGGLLASPARAQMADGEVVRVDQSSAKVTIRHGPLKKFDMDERMTMVWHVQDPALLKGLRPGDKIKFEPDRINGQFTASKIEKAK